VIEPMFESPLVAENVAKLRREREIDIGGGIFGYRFIIRRGRMTTRLFRFYDGLEFATLAVAPKGQQDNPASADGWLRSSLV